jgi:hypothetical protein
MANINHSSLTDPKLHEPKGVAAAASGQVYIADGSASGDWKYLPVGWGNYQDGGSAQTITTADTLLQNDGAGSATSEAYLPREIRGTSSLWDTTNDKILPINLGDSYMVRVDLPITAESGSPTEVILQLDIGGSGSTATVPIITTYMDTGRTTPYTLKASFPVFCGSTFVANKGQIYLNTDSGTITVTNPQVFITMLSSGDI